jgi:IS6 family transposase
MILNALAEKLKRRSKDDFKGRHYEATLILQAVSWYLRYPLSYRDIEELFLERGLEVDHAGTVNLGRGLAGKAGTGRWRA